MSCVHTDLDGLLDRCAACGARAGFEGRGDCSQTRARCTECCETGDWQWEQQAAMIKWNQQQRRTKTT